MCIACGWHDVFGLHREGTRLNISRTLFMALSRPSGSPTYNVSQMPFNAIQQTVDRGDTYDGPISRSIIGGRENFNQMNIHNHGLGPGMPIF